MEWTRRLAKRATKKYFGYLEKLENKITLSSNDPGIFNQWSLDKISATQSWSAVQGSNVVVAVIDSGIDIQHPDLKNNIWNNPGEIPSNNIDDDSNGFIDDINGWNFVENNNNVQDGYGHGTHVAGIIGAEGNNSVGVAGINWHISIMALRFQNNDGLGFTGEAIQAINYAVMMKQKYNINIVAINASWGNDRGTSSLLVNAINNANNNNILFVCAAGNSAVDCDINPRYPAAYNLPNIVSVAASDSYDYLAGFSNYGKNTIDITAPGISIYSTLPNNRYDYMSGTSQAAPQVSGAIALLASVKPTLSALEIKQAILDSVDKIPSFLDKIYSGGRLNIKSALEKIGIIFQETKPMPTAPVPVEVQEKLSGIVETVRINRIRGWVFSNVAQNRPIHIQLVINNKIIKTYIANINRPYLKSILGSSRHGFNIAIHKKWLSLGNNNISINAINIKTDTSTPIATINLTRSR